MQTAPTRAGTADHPITVEPFHGTVNVTFSDAQLASTKRALVLREHSHDPVFYIPFDDIYFDFLKKTDTTSRCPFKGMASYWGVTAVGEAEKDVMWAYETPIAGIEAIAGHGAFYDKKVRIEAVAEQGDRRIIE